MMEFLLVKHENSDHVWASLGNYTCAALGLRVQPINVGGEQYGFTVSCSPDEIYLEWIHVQDPKDWVSIPWEASRTQGPNGVLVLHQNGEPESLLKACVRSKKRSFDKADLVRLASAIGMPGFGPGSPVAELLRAIALHVSNNDEEFANDACSTKTEPHSRGVARR